MSLYFYLLLLSENFKVVYNLFHIYLIDIFLSTNFILTKNSNLCLKIFILVVCIYNACTFSDLSDPLGQNFMSFSLSQFLCREIRRKKFHDIDRSLPYLIIWFILAKQIWSIFLLFSVLNTSVICSNKGVSIIGISEKKKHLSTLLLSFILTLLCITNAPIRTQTHTHLSSVPLTCNTQFPTSSFTLLTVKLQYIHTLDERTLLKILDNHQLYLFYITRSNGQKRSFRYLASTLLNTGYNIYFNRIIGHGNQYIFTIRNI